MLILTKSKGHMPPTQDSQTNFKPNLICMFLSARARYIMSNPDEIPCIEYDTGIKICLAVSLGVFSLTKVEGKIGRKKNPWIIRKLNKALGLGRKSKKVWDILSISDNTANIEKYHPHETSKLSWCELISVFQSHNSAIFLEACNLE